MISHRKLTLLRTVLLSLLVVVPCFWHRIVSGEDLQSHLYNAWLCDLIRTGHVHGLQIRSQTTNILFDTAACKLLPLIGVSATERCLTAIMILIMFWGIYCLISRIAGQVARWIVPWIAVLCYGYVFQIGFSNFYLATGICVWVLVLAWDGPLWRTFASVPLLALAYLAHPIPVLWAAGLVIYARVARKLTAKWQAAFCFLALVGLEVVNGYLIHHYDVAHSKHQLLLISGADQIWLFGWGYVLISAVLMLLILIAFVDRLRSHGLADLSAQGYLLTAFVIAFLPNSISHPGDAAASLIPQRLSLFAAILLLAFVSRSRTPKWYLALSLLASTTFFVFLYRDIGRASLDERKIHALVASLPPGQRVLYFDRTRLVLRDDTFVLTQRLHTVHLISRACIGTCFDYMDYEPSTGQFQTRAYPGNAIVTASPSDSMSMQDGQYAIRASDLPLYGVIRCAGDQFSMHAMQAGETVADLPCK